MFGLFKKQVPVAAEETQLATVQVRDIKQYLVDEYKRAKDLCAINENLKEKLEAAEETNLKYKAALVTLDEYRSRLEVHEKQLQEKDRKIESLKEEKARINDQLNDCKIIMQRAAITKEAIQSEIIAEIKSAICHGIAIHRGNLSKEKAIEIVRKCRVEE